jgi:hypothetical protein
VADARTRERLERHVLDAAVGLRSVERQIADLFSAAGQPGFAVRRSELELARHAADRALRSALDDLLSVEPEPTESPAAWLTLEDVVADARRVLRLEQRTHDVFDRESSSDERAAAIRARNLAQERLRRDVAAYVRSTAAAEAEGSQQP